MFDSSELKVELHTLKSDLGRPLNTASESIFDTAKNRTVELDQIKAGLNELSETLSEQEDHLDNIISDRPMTSIASAFALGVMIGFMLRRH